MSTYSSFYDLVGQLNAASTEGQDDIKQQGDTILEWLTENLEGLKQKHCPELARPQDNGNAPTNDDTRMENKENEYEAAEKPSSGRRSSKRARESTAGDDIQEQVSRASKSSKRSDTDSAYNEVDEELKRSVQQMKVADLRDALGELGEKKTGRKAELVERLLRTYLRQAAGKSSKTDQMEDTQEDLRNTTQEKPMEDANQTSVEPNTDEHAETVKIKYLQTDGDNGGQYHGDIQEGVKESDKHNYPDTATKAYPDPLTEERPNVAANQPALAPTQQGTSHKATQEEPGEDANQISVEPITDEHAERAKIKSLQTNGDNDGQYHEDIQKGAQESEKHNYPGTATKVNGKMETYSDLLTGEQPNAAVNQPTPVPVPQSSSHKATQENPGEDANQTSVEPNAGKHAETAKIKSLQTDGDNGGQYHGDIQEATQESVQHNYPGTATKDDGEMKASSDPLTEERPNAGINQPALAFAPQNTSHKTTKADPSSSRRVTPKKRPEDNYELSDNDDDSENENSKKQKPIPDWARGKELEDALHQQFGPDGPDPDHIFEDVTDCDLESIFPVTKKRFQVRTSSGHWLPDRLTTDEKKRYRVQMGFDQA